eukprot:XP_015583896.1 uncharacterized protein LOC107262460 [Ricinus communis]
MIITGDDKAEISRLRNDLSVRFQKKNLGEVEYFLGLEVEKTERGYFIFQRRYANNLLESFSMGESKEMATPMEPNLKVEERWRKDFARYKKFMQNPRSHHLDVVKRILRYVKGSLEYGLMYKKNDCFLLSDYTDADWVGDAIDRRSTSGYYLETRFSCGLLVQQEAAYCCLVQYRS